MSDLSIFFVLDGSGSMGNVQAEVVKGLNDFVLDQQDEAKLSGDHVTFTLTVFDYQPSVVYLAEDILDVNPVKRSDTFLGGGTALYDAIGSTLTKAKEKSITGKKLFVIYTDGEENSSREYDGEKVGKMIEELQKDSDWTFVFMGSELEEYQAEKAANILSIQRGNTVVTYGGKSGTQHAFAGMSSATVAHKRAVVNQTESFYKDYDNVNLSAAIKNKDDEDEGTESSTEL